MSDDLVTFLNDLSVYEDLDGAGHTKCHQRTGWIETADGQQISDLLDSLLERQLPHDGEPTETLLTSAFMHLSQRFQSEKSVTDGPLCDDQIRERVVDLYRHLGEHSRTRHYLLSILTLVGGAPELKQFSELIVIDPPFNSLEASLPFFPLVQSKQLETEALFPRLLDGLEHISVAAPILDVANHVTRYDMVPIHPAAQKTAQLTSLLSGISGRLGALESDPGDFHDGEHDISSMVNDGIALAVAICDALALIGDRSAVGKINQLLHLGHRRLRVEAAAALSRLGDKTGTQTLLELAEDPSVRLRVLSYAEELDLLDRVHEQFRSSLSRAEAELACYLAEPTQFGISPGTIDLVDQRPMFWPGYDEPVECYLFRYAYTFAQGTFNNVGIAGPLVHTFTQNLAGLTPEEIYAVYAGWHAQHDEMYEIEVDQLTDRQKAEVRQFENRLWSDGYEDVQTISLGFFFEENTLIASARRNGTTGTAVVDAHDIHWHPAGVGTQPLGPGEVYSMYKGRKLLQTFNPED